MTLVFSQYGPLGFPPGFRPGFGPLISALIQFPEISIRFQKIETETNVETKRRKKSGKADFCVAVSSTRSTLLLFGREKQQPTFDCSPSAAVTAHAHRTPRQPLDRARVPSHRGTPSCWLIRASIIPPSRPLVPLAVHAFAADVHHQIRLLAFLRVHGRRARGKLRGCRETRRPALERALGYRVPRREGRRMLPGEQ